MMKFYQNPLANTLLLELRFFWQIRWAFEFDLIPILIQQGGDPHPVPREGSRGPDTTPSNFAVDCQSILALEIDGYSFANFPLGRLGCVAFFRKLLQHYCCVHLQKPTPAQLALNHPLFGHLEAESVNIISNRLFDICHGEKRHSLLDVGPGIRNECHCSNFPITRSISNPSAYGRSARAPWRISVARVMAGSK